MTNYIKSSQFSTLLLQMAIFALLVPLSSCEEEPEPTSYTCSGIGYCREISGSSGPYSSLEECVADGCKDPNNNVVVRVDSICEFLDFQDGKCYRHLRIITLDGEKLPYKNLKSGYLRLYNDNTFLTYLVRVDGNRSSNRGSWSCSSNGQKAILRDGAAEVGELSRDNTNTPSLETSLYTYRFAQLSINRQECSAYD